MPSGDSWNDPPSRSSREFFLQAMGEHTKVERVEEETSQRYTIVRHGVSDVLVVLTNVYTLGIADYLALREAHPDADCVVTLSGYNSYTRDAKEQGHVDGVGVFKFGELMGALHREGHDFVFYGGTEGQSRGSG